MSDLQRGDGAAAAQRLRPLLAADPDNADILHLMGIALCKAARGEEGVAFLARAVARNPRQPDFLINFANIRRERGELDEAEPLLRRAVALAPQYGKGWQVLGSLLRQREKLSEALECRRKALALDPASSSLQARLASALVDARQVAEGLSAYREALRRDPANLVAHSSLALAAHYVMGDKSELFALQRAAGAAIAAKLPSPLPHANARTPERRLRVGYVSADFHQHSVAFFLSRVFPAHDPARVEGLCLFRCRQARRRHGALARPGGELARHARPVGRGARRRDPRRRHRRSGRSRRPYGGQPPGYLCPPSPPPCRSIGSATPTRRAWRRWTRG